MSYLHRVGGGHSHVAWDVPPRHESIGEGHGHSQGANSDTEDHDMGWLEVK